MGGVPVALHSFRTNNFVLRASVRLVRGWTSKFVFLMLTLAVSNSAAAQELSVNWFGGAGNWSNASDWGGCLNGNPCVPNNSGNLTYDVSLPAFVNGYEVFEDVQFVQVNKLSVGVCINNIDLNINSGSELVLLSGNSYNYCILQNAGTLNVFNNTIGTLSTVTNDSGAYLGNAGTLLILGRVNNTFGTLQNSGLTTIFGGPQLPNGAYGILNNYSPFSGSQSLGGILNTGTIKNFGVFNNTTTANFPAEINNSTGGTIENGYLTNQNVPGNLNNNANSILNNNVGATLNNNALSVLNNYGIVKTRALFITRPQQPLTIWAHGIIPGQLPIWVA